MKFKYTPPPKHDDTRVVKKFAWLPTLIDGSGEQPYKVWLEYYERHERFYEDERFYEAAPYRGEGWRTIKTTQRTKLERALD